MPRLCVNKNTTLMQSTIGAFKGFMNAVRTEAKVRQVLIAAVCVTIVSLFMDVGYFQTMMIIFSWVLALICEIFNTALEKALDYSCDKEYHPLVRDGKDYASACTFIALIFAGSLSIFLIADRIVTNLKLLRG